MFVSIHAGGPPQSETTEIQINTEFPVNFPFLLRILATRLVEFVRTLARTGAVKNTGEAALCWGGTRYEKHVAKHRGSCTEADATAEGGMTEI